MTNPAINLLTESCSSGIGFSVDNGVTLIHVSCFVFADEDAIVSGQSLVYYWKVIKKGAYYCGRETKVSQKGWRTPEEAASDLLRFLKIIDWVEDDPVFDSGMPINWLLRI